MLLRILWSVIVGTIAGVLSWLVGTAFVATGIVIVVTIGSFLVAVSAVVGFLAGLIYFVSGRTFNQI